MMSEHTPADEPTSVPAATAATAPADATPELSPAPASTAGDPVSAAATAASPTPRGPGKKRRADRPAPGGRREVHPVLHTLFELYPQLFGARFLPLKLGVFEELVAAHPDRLKPEELKVAMGLHARSNRYLEAVASGLPRHDLSGQPIEPVAPEHVHHAIVELYRRKSNTPHEPAARNRAVQQLVAAIGRSGLDRDAYRERFGGGAESTRALLEEALAQIGQQAARREALSRAFQASGATVEAFAEMYGLSPAEVRAMVQATPA